MNPIKERTCELCGIPLGHRSTRSDKKQFCCAGCARVYDVLQGLDETAGANYLKAARRLGIIPEEPEEKDANNSASGEKMNPVLSAEKIEAEKTERFQIGGLLCPSCAWVCEQIIRSQEGILEANTDFITGSALVRYDMRRSAPDTLRDSLAEFGYSLQRFEDEAIGSASRLETIKFVICAVISVNIMSLASVRYFERLGYVDDLPIFIAWIELLLLLPILWIGLIPMIKRAVGGIRGGSMTMEFLLSVAVSSALALSVVALISGRPDIYFETCAGLISINLLSRMIEEKLRNRASGDLLNIMRMPVTKVRRVKDGNIEYVEIDDIRPGDITTFGSGDIIPFDGEISDGEVLVSEAVLTGEPKPVQRVIGEKIIAGSTVVEGDFLFLVTSRFEETRLYLIAESVRDSMKQANSKLRSADRISSWFTPGVLAIAVAVWLFRGYLYGWNYCLTADGWFPSVAILAVACPCAFSLAGVSAITAGFGSLLRMGILVKETNQMEDLYKVSHVFFDKTGTLTRGDLHVEKLIWKDKELKDCLSKILALEEGSFHPVAYAIRKYLMQIGVVPELVDKNQIIEFPGKGRGLDVVGNTEGQTESNQRFLVGSKMLFSSPFVPDGLSEQHTVVWFGYKSKIFGSFLLSDTIRQEARLCISEIKNAGLEVEILSGDRVETTEWVASELNIKSAWGEVSLERKMELVEEKKNEGVEIAYVGDGTNDALALSEATVSIAVPRSTDEALAASGVVLLHNDISLIPRLFSVGKKLRKVIISNYIWAFLFNIVFIPVAATGNLVPLFAMLLMLFSSSAVLLNSLRMRNLSE